MPSRASLGRGEFFSRRPEISRVLTLMPPLHLQSLSSLGRAERSTTD